MKKITFLFVALCATVFANATSISDALAAASSLADGKQTTERYSVSGKVVYASINTSYGNADFVIEDGSDLLYCWRTFDLDSAKFTAADKIAVGDSITVYGALKRYDALNFSAYPAYTSKIEMVYGYVTELNGVAGGNPGGDSSEYNETFTMIEAYNYYDYLTENAENITLYLYSDPDSEVYVQLDLLVENETGLGNVLPTGVYNINNGLTVGSAYIGELDESGDPIGCWAFGEGASDYWDIVSGTVTITKEGNVYTIVVDAVSSDAVVIKATYTGEVEIEVGGFVDAISNVEASLEVYTNNGNIVVPAEVGQRIEVYNMMGQTLYSGMAQNAETTISGLATQQVLVVRAGNKTAKVVL